MKKIAYFLSLVFLMTAFAPAAIAAENDKDKSKTELSEADKERLAEIEARVDEIKEINFSDMDKEERRALKKELKEMNKEAKQLSGGVYISVGAIILILLLLILLT
jgi:Flp pilus assembly protein TadB